MFSLKRFVLNCRCQAGIKTKSSVQVLFFEKSAEMQLLNSNIPQGAQTTKYSNKKAQDLLNLVLFCCVAFSYYKDGGSGGNRTHVLLGCQKTFYILIPLIFLKIGCERTRRRFRTGFNNLMRSSRSPHKIFPPF